MSATTLKTFEKTTFNLKVACVVCLSFLSNGAKSQERLNQMNSRMPASVEEEVLTVPLTKSMFSNEVMFAEDDSGVMKSIKEEVSSWEEKEEFAKIWGLEGVEVYDTPEQSDKRAYLSKKMFRYLDRRLNGEMKKAEQGSALYTIGRVEQNLRPNANVQFSKDFAVKVKARVLQGKIVFDFRNPWLECNTTVSLNGKAKLITKKEFKELEITTGAEYSVTESEMMAYVDHHFTDNVKARLSSTQEGGTNIFGNSSDAKIEMTATFPFNF